MLEWTRKGKGERASEGMGEGVLKGRGEGAHAASGTSGDIMRSGGCHLSVVRR